MYAQGKKIFLREKCIHLSREDYMDEKGGFTPKGSNITYSRDDGMDKKGIFTPKGSKITYLGGFTKMIELDEGM